VRLRTLPPGPATSATAPSGPGVSRQQLINTRALQALPPGQRLDITRRPIHAALLRRLMYLDAAVRNRTRDQLTADPVYARYLAPADFDTLFQASAEAGETL